MASKETYEHLKGIILFKKNIFQCQYILVPQLAYYKNNI